MLMTAYCTVLCELVDISCQWYGVHCVIVFKLSITNYWRRTNYDDGRYALAFGFFKLINYAMFFWLPFFLSLHFTPQQSNLISVLYDIGMMPGGIIVGYVSDMAGGRRACVIVAFMGVRDYC